MEYIYYIAIAVVFFGLGYIIKQIHTVQDEVKQLKATLPAMQNNAAAVLQLQAYEKLLQLSTQADLLKLMHAVHAETRTTSADELRKKSIEKINQIFEEIDLHKIHTSNTLSDALAHFKNQNIFIVNEMHRSLADEATAKDMLEQTSAFLAQPNTNFTPIIQQAIKNELHSLRSY